MIMLVGGAMALVVAAVATLLVVRPWEPTAQPPPESGVATPGTSVATAGPFTESGPAPGPVTATVSADCVSEPSRDAGGTPTSYDPGNAIDDRTETAWRCDGDGVDQELRVDFGRPGTLTEVGIVPGLAKTDPVDGTDRYRQGRRISAVRYSFDGGGSVTQQLDTSPDDRSVQRLSVAPVTTATMTVTVLSSVEGSAVGALPPTDKVAISTLTWSAT